MSKDIIQLLDSSSIIESYIIIKSKTFVNGFFIKIIAKLQDESFLHIKEYNEKSGLDFIRDYLYHWQNSNYNIIIRWDNSFHHKNLSSFPHHKHIGKENNITESKEIFFEEVLSYITSQLKK